MDTFTGRNKPAIMEAAKDLVDSSVVVIPVAIGNRPVPDFEKEFPDEEVIKTKDKDHPIKTADTIEEILVSGK